MVTICLLIGLPAVGKSTLAKLLREKFSDEQTHCCIFEYDSLMPQDIEFPGISHFDQNDCEAKDKSCARNKEPSLIPEGDPGKPLVWKDFREEIFKYVEHLIVHLNSDARQISFDEYDFSSHIKFCENLSLCSCFLRLDSEDYRKQKSKHIFFIDDNMFYRSMRYSYYRLASRHGCSFCQIYVQCSQDIISSRNSQRDVPISDETILRMSLNLQSPDPDKYNWERNSITIDSKAFFSNASLLLVRDFLHQCKPLTNTVDEYDATQKENDRKICLDNLIHRTDQKIRKFISSEMIRLKNECVDKSQLKQSGARYSAIRKQLLASIRSGETQLEQDLSDEDLYKQIQLACGKLLEK